MAAGYPKLIAQNSAQRKPVLQSSNCRCPRNDRLLLCPKSGLEEIHIVLCVPSQLSSFSPGQRSRHLFRRREQLLH